MEKKQVVVCIMGPAASGKTVQADLIAQQLAGSRITIDSLLRQAMQSDLPIGREITKLVRTGSIIGLKVIKPLVDSIMNWQQNNTIVLDSFPRTTEQAELFLSYAQAGRYILAIELILDEETIIQRIKNRLATPGYMPTAVDDLRLVKENLELYNINKQSIRQVFVDGMIAGKHMNYFQVDGTASMQTVYTKIMEFIRTDLSY